jgi:hypothetical protein
VDHLFHKVQISAIRQYPRLGRILEKVNDL